MKLTADNGLKEIHLTVSNHEFQLLLLASSWMLKKSEKEERAQTKALRSLESELRGQYHELLRDHSLLDTLIFQILNESTSRESLKKFIPPRRILGGEAPTLPSPK